MTDHFLPYGRQTIEDDDIAAVAAALKSDFLTTGPLVEKFETAFARATGADHAVACNSGTAALHLSALALDLKEGEAAVVPALTFLATANAARMTGAEIVFADVDADTGLLTPETLSDAIEKAKKNGLKLRGALPVHLNGQICDMVGLAKIAEQYALTLIEDACHALGEENIGAAKYSAATCFSTHAVKTIATGEGGVATTRDIKIAERMRRFRSHGMIREPEEFSNRELAFDGNMPNPWYYEMKAVGWNYRLPDILCALGLAQLKKLDRFFHRRREIAALYDRLLAPLAPAIRPVPHGQRPHGWHLYVILIDFAVLKTTRARVMNALRNEGIGTQVHYMPLHLQPYYRARYGEMTLPGAETYYARCLSIPFFPAMNNADVERVANAIVKLTRKGSV
jgi:UDP-4-amino-4,6-dideoxy-N-acetyl-beta-L-altrosamine transaminase